MLNDYQKQVDEWAQTLKVPYWSPMSNLAHLVEEVGELSRAFNHRYGDKPPKPTDEPDNIPAELADIIFTIVCIANSEGIDLDEALKKSLEKSKVRDKDRFEKK